MLRVTAALVALSVLATVSVAAKVTVTTLAELEREAEFIGIVRVDRISRHLPFFRRPRATALIVHSWKGQAMGTLTFVAAPTWTCDISGARIGEEAVLFVRDGSLLLAGRGRMPIFSRHGRRLAAIWPEVILPAGTITEDGPEPEIPSFALWG